MRSTLTDSKAEALDLLLEKVYRDGRHDFRGYKRGTITRRLERRLQAIGLKTYLEYMQFLDAHPEEYQRLTNYLTITVSGLFRSPYAFQEVAELVLPELISRKKVRGERGLRFWSTACARGEEAYSIALLLTEFLGHGRQDFEISIYASDINMDALKEAQAGIYENTDGLSGTILERHFTRGDEGYAVNSDIRQMVRFFYFDLVSTTSSPFLNLDCVFCCNILIYLQKQLQKRVLDMLYNSLGTPGYLILGEVETPTDNLRGRLECLNAKAKIYKKVT